MRKQKIMSMDERARWLISIIITMIIYIISIMINGYNNNIELKNKSLQIEELQLELNRSTNSFERLSCLNQASGICYQEQPKQYNGMAYGDTCFAVYTKGRKYSDIMETCNHEYMHTNGQMKDVK